MTNPANSDAQIILGDMSLEDMLEPGAPAPRAGGEREKRTGLIASVQEKDVLVEFGPKAQCRGVAFQGQIHGFLRQCFTLAV